MQEVVNVFFASKEFKIYTYSPKFLVPVEAEFTGDVTWLVELALEVEIEDRIFANSRDLEPLEYKKL